MVGFPKYGHIYGITQMDGYFQDLSDLIVYCRSKRIRPWSWDAQKETSVCNMFSFNESAALSRCKDTTGKLQKHNLSLCINNVLTEMLACTERQFIRTYPHGTRIDSSNYDPIPLWNHGIQIVALNVQTPGKCIRRYLAIALYILFHL